MTIQDKLAALPGEPKGPGCADEDMADYWADKCDYMEARLALAERLLRAVLDSGLEPGGRDYGMVAVKITDYNDARAYLAWREAE